MSAKKSEAVWATPNLFILHVEDNPDDRELFQLAADQTRAPVQWHTAHSADDAIRYLERLESLACRECVRWPDLMLLDIVMPPEGGTKVLRYLNSRPLLKKFPIIALTGSEDQTIAREIQALGAHSLLVKPQSFEQLALFIDSIYRTWSRAKSHVPISIGPGKKFLVFCYNTTASLQTQFCAECERAGAVIKIQMFDTLPSAWGYLQILTRLKNMKTVNWPDLVLLDLTSNHDSGWALLSLIRSTREFDGLPIIAFVPECDRTAASRAYKLGASPVANETVNLGKDVKLLNSLNSAWNTLLPESDRMVYRNGVG